VSARRQKVTIEFLPPDDGEVAARLAQLTAAGDGWINLIPGVPEDSPDLIPPTGLSAIFGSRQLPVTMTTLMAARPDRKEREGLTVGLMHPTGSKAVARLAEAGIALPDGWVVRQDHARRGLLLQCPVGADEAEVIAWSVRAGTELCRAEMTGRWQAVVYLPVAAS
jgi:hypothetical protein